MGCIGLGLACTVAGSLVESRRATSETDARVIVQAITLHRVHHPDAPCPRSVDELVAAGVLSESSRRVDAWGTAWRFVCSSEFEAHVISAGPDGVHGTCDDINDDSVGECRRIEGADYRAFGMVVLSFPFALVVLFIFYGVIHKLGERPKRTRELQAMLPAALNSAREGAPTELFLTGQVHWWSTYLTLSPNVFYAVPPSLFRPSRFKTIRIKGRGLTILVVKGTVFVTRRGRIADQEELVAVLRLALAALEARETLESLVDVAPASGPYR